MLNEEKSNSTSNNEMKFSNNSKLNMRSIEDNTTYSSYQHEITDNSNKNCLSDEKEYLMEITQEVYDKIYKFIGQHQPERGGMLGRNNRGIITHFYPDSNGKCSYAAYDPDIKTLNIVIKEWEKDGIEFCGFVHSHPQGIISPSYTDKEYSSKILDCFKSLDFLWLPIVQTTSNNSKFQLLPYLVIKTQGNVFRIRNANFKINENGGKMFNNNQRQSTKSPNITQTKPKVSEISNEKTIIEESLPIDSIQYYGYQKQSWNFEVFLNKTFLSGVQSFDLKTKGKELEEIYKVHFQKIQNDYDLNLLNETRLLIIGTGGAASLIKNCARMGIGEIIMIDPDIIEAKNIATQDVYPESIGKYKVDVLAEEIIKINPLAAVLTIKSKIEDINDIAFSKLISGTLRQDIERMAHFRVKNGLFSPPKSVKQTVLLGLTDNFYAQARCNRLGLNFGLSTICAQEYSKGVGAEITFTVPGITPACHRCISANRYKAYLENGYKNTITSDGAPVFAAEYLNACLGHILLAVVHHNKSHERWGKVISNLGNRNLIRLRMDHSYDAMFNKPHFDVNNKSTYMLDSLFQEQIQDHGQSHNTPICPDCKGTGNLLDAKNRFDDTRIMINERGR